MIKNSLGEMWRKKELSIGRIIPVMEVAKETGISWDAISRLKDNETTRYDARVIAKICKFFEMPEDEPVPFLIFTMTD